MQIKSEQSFRLTSRMKDVVIVILLVVIMVLTGRIVTLQQDNAPLLYDATIDEIVENDEDLIWHLDDFPEEFRPANVLADGGILLGFDGSASAELNLHAPTISIAFDYTCPFSKMLEEINASDLFHLANDGIVNVVFYPVGILNHATPDYFSTRAAAATYWIASNSPEHFLAFHVAVFINDYQELEIGFTDSELAQIAVTVGVSPEVAAGIADGRAIDYYAGWAWLVSEEIIHADAWQSINNDGHSGFATPTILWNGVQTNVEWFVESGISTFIWEQLSQ